ncbi:MAG: class I SAM-dependent methyltransferase [Bacillota bacterium]
MQLFDIVSRNRRPEPWTEGENIPWNDPGFSRRMLQEHLSQEHDLASRRAAVIESQVAWIHQGLLAGRPARVLDLGCGPGLYCQALARLGHTCTGVDWAPAAVEYARQRAAAEALPITYLLEDVRTAEPPGEQELVMMLYGEFNVFRPAHAAALLEKAHRSLKPGGSLLLEPHTVEGVRQGAGERAWWAIPTGLFSERPHLGLEESFWEEATQTKTVRYYVVDAGTGGVTAYAASYQAYSREGFTALLTAAGFTEIAFRESLSEAYPQPGLQVITARKGP